MTTYIQVERETIRQVSLFYKKNLYFQNSNNGSFPRKKDANVEQY